ncbi:hypothetical protein ALC60_00253 [Trachymyrmex zeteki]|uniref:Uncharacterized protein n=1 Tax=Mycetomoellerius zeteki TaxID=64791 RepID=A0A151XK23_9HYME|nr:hypothetical protein ALC60_00253 [Trachymyrmex zeteki]
MIRAKVSEREDLKWLEEYCNMPLRDVRTPSDSRKSVRRENRHSLISYVALARATEAGERLKSGRLARLCRGGEGERWKKEVRVGKRGGVRGGARGWMSLEAKWAE